MITGVEECTKVAFARIALGCACVRLPLRLVSETDTRSSAGEEIFRGGEERPDEQRECTEFVHSLASPALDLV